VSLKTDLNNGKPQTKFYALSEEILLANVGVPLYGYIPICKKNSDDRQVIKWLYVINEYG